VRGSLALVQLRESKRGGKESACNGTDGLGSGARGPLGFHWGSTNVRREGKTSHFSQEGVRKKVKKD